MAAETPRNGSRRRSGSALGDKQQLSEKVASYVREAIMVGELSAGSHIRTEHLAEELGVSATPVREALMILHSEGSVRWEPRRGYRVVPMTARDVEDLFEVQAFIAGELAARAAELLSGAEIERITKLQGELEVAAHEGDVRHVDELNHEIHRTINRASESHRMTTLLNLTVQYVPLNFFGTIRGWAEASAYDHSAIFDALRDRDAAAARTAMVDHIRHIGRLLIDHLRTRGDVLQS